MSPEMSVVEDTKFFLNIISKVHFRFSGTTIVLLKVILIHWSPDAKS